MALWRDPLDELIADLERALPAEAASSAHSDRELVGMQMLVAAVLSGSDEQRTRAEQDPRVQAYLEASRRMVRRREAREVTDGKARTKDSASRS